MPALAAPEVAKLLHEFGQRMAFRGGNPYRARAYTRAAENLMALTEPLEDLVAHGRLQEIPGVGDAIIEQLRKLASERDMTLDEQGLRSGKKVIASRTEEDIYRALDLPFIEPELREGGGEIDLAKNGKLPQLVTFGGFCTLIPTVRMAWTL